jgi:hypothetical protein
MRSVRGDREFAKLAKTMAKNFSHRRWADKVYNPDIVSKSEKLSKKPGYTT